jgi:solute carrier family 25, member 39/40
MTELRGSAADPSRSPHAISDAAARRGSKQRAAPTTTNTTDGSAPTSNPLASPSPSPSPCSYASSCKSSPLYARIVSGSVGSVITSLLVTPLEVVKVRQQALSFEQQQQQQMTTTAAALQSPQRPSGVSASLSRGGSKGMASAAAPSPGVTLCRRGCGTFVLNNGLGDCLLPKSAVPYFDRTTGLLTEAARGTLAAATADGSVGTAQTISNKPPKPAGTLAMLRRIFRREGLGGIYAGLRPTLVMAVPNTVLYFSAYDELVYRFRNDGRDYVDPASPLIPLLAGGGARFLASGVTAPFEFLRTRQASLVGSAAIQPPTAAGAGGGLVREFRAIVEREGVGALYRGLRPTLWRDVPFSAIYWLCLEEMRLVWKERARSTASISPSEQAMQAFVNGAVSGMIAACFTTPFDVLKTRQQQLAQQQQAVTEEAAVVASNAARAAAVSCSHDGAVVFYGGPNPPVTPAPSPSTFGSLRQIASTEGVSALWRGNQARMLKVAPACAIMISSYELGKRILLDAD